MMNRPAIKLRWRLAFPLALGLLGACAQAPVSAPPAAEVVTLSREDRTTFFVHAARSGDLAEARQQLAAGADVNGFDTLDQTALIAAVDHNHIGIVGFLLDQGADPKLGDHAGWTPLIHAAYFGANEALLNLLIDRGGDVNAPNDRGVTPLYLAAAAGREEQVRVLLQRGANPALATKAGYTPKQVAQMRGLERIVALLEGRTPPPAAPASVPTAAPASPAVPSKAAGAVR